MRQRAGVWLACLLSAALAVAGAASAKPKDAQGPVKLERLEAWAERVVFHAGSSRFTFERNVTVIKGDLRVDCNEMEGTVDSKSRRITKVSALGNVRMMTVEGLRPAPRGRRPKPKAAGADAWRATSGRADYDLKAGRIVLSGKQGAARPRLWRADGYGEADKIVFLPDKGEYELIGDPVIRGQIPVGPVGRQPEPNAGRSRE